MSVLKVFFVLFLCVLQDGYTLRHGPGVTISEDGEGRGWVELCPASSGWYQCTAYNTAGSCATRARVVVDPPPIPPMGVAQQPKIILPAHSRTILPE